MRCSAPGCAAACAPRRAAVIRAINHSGRPVFALDVPSGLDGDAGTVLGDEAVRAEATVTFVGLKTGLFVGDGPEFAGTVFCDDLEISPAPSAQPAPRLTRIVEAEIHEALPRRPRSSNKGDFGRVLIVGGGQRHAGGRAPGGRGVPARRRGTDDGRGGAGERRGDRRRPTRADLRRAHRRERAGRGDRARGRRSRWGPGSGARRGRSARSPRCSISGKPLVVDADALNLLAESGTAGARDDWILTPHPGEAGRLLGASAQEIQRDRLAALERLRRALPRHGRAQGRRHAGRRTAGARPGCASAATPAWRPPAPGTCSPAPSPAFSRSATTPGRRRASGCWCTRMAGDAAARAGERGVLASDLTRELHHCVNL